MLMPCNSSQTLEFVWFWMNLTRKQSSAKWQNGCTPTKLQPALHSLDKDFANMGHLVSWRSIQKKQLQPFSIATSQPNSWYIFPHPSLYSWWWWQENIWSRHNLQLPHMFEGVEHEFVSVNNEDLDTLTPQWHLHWTRCVQICWDYCHCGLTLRVALLNFLMSRACSK